MSTGAIVALVVVLVLVLAAAGWFLWNQYRSRQLRERFGSEYDRMVADKDNRRDAERELAQREKRHAELDIRPLPAERRDRYAEEWEAIQQRFVDQPDAAVAEADRLVTAVLAERGYPTENFRQQLADLSVRHANVLDNYRAAHDIRDRVDGDLNGGNGAGRVSTEELRTAMVHYRTMFADLLESSVDNRTVADRPEQAHHRT